MHLIDCNGLLDLVNPIDCNGLLDLVNPRDQGKETFQILLTSIMIFVTGMAEEPPLGFNPKPSLAFHSDQGKYVL